MKKIIFCLGFFLLSCSQLPSSGALYQVSGMSMLLNSNFEGQVSYLDIDHHGDFGIGTFDSLDGEMIALNNVFYRLNTQGSAHPIDLSKEKAPLASVIYFKPQGSFMIDQKVPLEELEEVLLKKIDTQGKVLALKIEARFESALTRSIEKQSKPYPQAKEVIKNQKISSYENLLGTLVGFRGIPSLKDYLVDGLHFHLIDRDKKRGGHVLDFMIEKAKVEWMRVDALKIVFYENPQSGLKDMKGKP